MAAGATAVLMVQLAFAVEDLEMSSPEDQLVSFCEFLQVMNKENPLVLDFSQKPTLDLSMCIAFAPLERGNIDVTVC